jgi:hypothetical protein
MSQAINLDELAARYGAGVPTRIRDYLMRAVLAGLVKSWEIIRIRVYENIAAYTKRLV